jgi:hypothetical protein
MGKNGDKGKSKKKHEATEAKPTAGGLSRRKFVAGAGAVGAAVATKAKPARAAQSSGDPIYRIHPAIGVARIGNADSSTFFIGPEAPGYGPLGSAPGTVVPPYKTADGKIKPQAARFRIYEYQNINGRLTPVREINLGTPGVIAIRWTVYLANKKASFYQFGDPNFRNGRGGEVGPPNPLRNGNVTDRRSLEIDFGPRTIAGKSQGPTTFEPGGSANPSQENCPRDVNGNPVIPYLGELRTDDAGRLIVIGGKGRAGYQSATPLPSYANNDGWWDDTSDGPVTAVVTIKTSGGQRDIAIDANGEAWVLSGGPDFAPRVAGAVTGYDLLFDLAVRSIPIPADNALYDDGAPLEKLRRLKADYTPGADLEFPTYVPSFTEDIQPILINGYNYWWVDALVPARHDMMLDPNLGNPDPQYAADRADFFSFMRPPLGVDVSGSTGTMPKLMGDDPYTGSLPDAVKNFTLTHLQWGLLSNWVNGQFVPPTGDGPPPAVISPHGLDRAALENCSGGPFFPGIEFGWQMRNPALFLEPFRLNGRGMSGYWGEENVPVGPGHFSRQMALPWHADFNDCRDEGSYGWWPHQRPTGVLPSATATKRVDWARPTKKWASGGESSYSDMIANWYKFGFVLEEGELFVEKERAPSIP